MNPNDTLQIAARKIITGLAGYLIMRGVLDEKDVTPQLIDLITGGVMVLGTTLWSWLHYTKPKTQNEP